ncbi:MAG: hypothetical protein JSS82_02945 [Bacteroidetes bacterium]|nr:hypothetical protein [Bacteroidota bacterium]
MKVLSTMSFLLAIACIFWLRVIYNKHKREKFKNTIPNLLINAESLKAILALSALLALAVTIDGSVEKGYGAIDFFKFLAVIFLVTFLIYQAACKQHKVEGELIMNETNKTDQVKNLTTFNKSEGYMSVDKTVFLAIDKSSNKICIVDEASNSHYYSQAEIIACEIIEDNQMLSISDHVGIGGIVGHIGVGAGTSISQQLKTIKEVVLKITVNDLRRPSYAVTFFRPKRPTLKTHKEYKDAINHALHWHEMLIVLIRNASQIVNDLSSNKNDSIDKLNGLFELLQKGAITQVEYDIQKQKLFS